MTIERVPPHSKGREKEKFGGWTNRSNSHGSIHQRAVGALAGCIVRRSGRKVPTTKTDRTQWKESRGEKVWEKRNPKSADLAAVKDQNCIIKDRINQKSGLPEGEYG